MLRPGDVDLGGVAAWFWRTVGWGGLVRLGWVGGAQLVVCTGKQLEEGYCRQRAGGTKRTRGDQDVLGLERALGAVGVGDLDRVGVDDGAPAGEGGWSDGSDGFVEVVSNGGVGCGGV